MLALCYDIHRADIMQHDKMLHYTVEFQWVKHLWNHEILFETGVVPAYEC